MDASGQIRGNALRAGFGEETARITAERESGNLARLEEITLDMLYEVEGTTGQNHAANPGKDHDVRPRGNRIRDPQIAIVPSTCIA